MYVEEINVKFIGRVMFEKGSWQGNTLHFYHLVVRFSDHFPFDKSYCCAVDGNAPADMQLLLYHCLAVKSPTERRKSATPLGHLEWRHNLRELC